MGSTDCAQPMIYARQKKLEVDVFIVYTDNETWAGMDGAPLRLQLVDSFTIGLFHLINVHPLRMTRFPDPFRTA